MVGGNRGVGDSKREQADRWLVTSEELLSSGDFQGAKTFAIRACEADPSLADAADHIIAISDTLIAGESTVGDFKLPDWYAVLRVARLTRSPEHVAAQYRRLTLLLNPNVNRLSFADQALKLVSDAWSVLSDPPRKSLYDRELQLSQINKPHSQSEQKDSPLQSQAEISKNPVATSFWTACPFCFALFEYPKRYEECTLRCQHCRRAFEAVTTQTPPVESNGEGVYLCSWVMIPLGFAGHGKSSASSPISPLFAYPPQGSNHQVNMKAPPRNEDNIDDDIYVVISDEEDDHDDWIYDAKRNKKAKIGKRKETAVKSNKKTKEMGKVNM